MKSHTTMNRRILNSVIFSAGFVSLLTACTGKEKTRVVRLDPEKIKSLDDLIREIKIGAGDKLPQNLDVRDIYKRLAEAFVEYAHDAIQAGVNIPNAIRNKLPMNKKVVIPALMIFTMWGVQFIIPIASFFNAILGSIAVMGIFIYTAITSVNAKPKVNS